MARSDASGFSAGMRGGGPLGASQADVSVSLADRSRAGRSVFAANKPGAQAQPHARGPGDAATDLGRWPTFLADLGILGHLWVQVDGSGVRLSQRAAMAGLGVTGALGHLDSPTLTWRVLLDYCEAVRPLAEDAGLAIEDAQGRPVLQLGLEADAHPWALRLLLASIGATGRAVRPAVRRAGVPEIAAIDAHVIGRLQQDLARLGKGPNLMDLAELSGCLPMQPQRFRHLVSVNGSRALPVDPSLVPCALETLADQVHPIMLTTGSTGWVSCTRVQFYGHRLMDRRLWLRGDGVQFELETSDIDSAWLVGPESGHGAGRSLRLYDAAGRAMAVLASADGCESGAPDSAGQNGEAPLWRSLMNALRA